MLAVTSIGGCESNSDSAANSVEPGGSKKASSEASANSKAEQDEESSEWSGETDGTSGASSLSLPGDKQPGDLQPERLGPKGPAVMFMTGLKGYLEPCGCTADVLLGGIERIVGYVSAAETLYRGTVMVDSGDLLFSESDLQEHQIAPEKSSIDVLVKAYQAMDVRVTVPGELDFALGASFYGETLERMGVEPLAANATVTGVETKPSAVKTVGSWKVGFVGSVEPSLFDEIDVVSTKPAVPAVRKQVQQIRDTVGAVVVLHHGGLASAKELLEEVDGVDFVVVGHKPREKASPDAVGGGFTLETFDQGRYVGVLSLHQRDKSRPFENARVGADQSVDEIDRQIQHVKDSLSKLPTDEGAEAPPIVDRLEERLASLKQKRAEAEGGGVELPSGERGFVYRSVGMRPGFPISGEIQKARASHNRRLKRLSMQVEREVASVEEGEPTYIGSNQCAGCHGDSHEFWKKTDHASAVQTLKERNKAFDQKCIGCHVVGYEKPGGSVLGKLEYEATVDGRSITKNLKDVGCESCHGPGSNHWTQPVGSDGEPQGIIRDPGRGQCMSCHVEEHSPAFEFETYVRKVTGPGHERSTQ
jgi:hypothetical protein